MYGFVFGRLILKTNSRIISGVTLIVTGVLFAVFGMVTSITLYIAVLVLICFFAAGFGTIACPAFMAAWFPRKKGIALGWATMGAPLSSAFFVTGFSLLLDKCGVKTAFLIVGIATVIIGVLSFFWAKNDPAEVGALPDHMELDDSFQLEEKPVDDKAFSIANILKNKNTWLIAIGFGLLWMVTVGVISQFIPRMISVGYTSAEALRFMLISSLIAIPGSYFWGVCCLCGILCNCVDFADYFVSPCIGMDWLYLCGIGNRGSVESSFLHDHISIWKGRVYVG